MFESVVSAFLGSFLGVWAILAIFWVKDHIEFRKD